MTKILRLPMLLIMAACIVSCGEYEPYENLIVTRLEYSQSFLNSYYIPAGPKPMSKLLIIISGSGYGSVLGRLANDEWITRGDAGVFESSKLFSKDYDLFVPERLNVELGQDHTGDRMVLDTYTVEDRSGSMAYAIDAFLISPEASSYSEIYLFGHSQGGGLVPKIYDALENKTKISKIIITSASSGLSMYDGFVAFRGSGIASTEEMSNFNELENIYAKVQLNKDSIDELWLDDPYKMWHSFFDYLPLDYLKNIDIPILLVHGKADTSAPIQGAGVVVSEFERLGKTNLTFIEMDGGHFCWVDNLDILAAWIEE